MNWRPGDLVILFGTPILCILLLFWGTGVIFPDKADASPHAGVWADCTADVYTPDPLRGTRWKLGRAIRQWNEVGVVHLRRVTDPASAEIVVREEAHDPDEWVGLAVYGPVTGGRLSGVEVLLNSRMERDPARGLVTLHELGHALGLGHYPGGVMAPHPNTGITAVDVIALGGLYLGACAVQ